MFIQIFYYYFCNKKHYLIIVILHNSNADNYETRIRDNDILYQKLIIHNMNLNEIEVKTNQM